MNWWRWNDSYHIAAHRADFSVPPEDVMDLLEGEVRPSGERTPDRAKAEQGRTLPVGPGSTDANGVRWLHRDFEMDREIGVTGLRVVPEDGSQSFWAYRQGRKIPSHLSLGSKEPTRWVCLWGWWEDTAENPLFVVHTIYPGRVAPREIHDPDLPLRDIAAAIRFWKNHAIIVAEGEYADTPYP